MLKKFILLIITVVLGVSIVAGILYVKRMRARPIKENEVRKIIPAPQTGVVRQVQPIEERRICPCCHGYKYLTVLCDWCGGKGYVIETCSTCGGLGTVKEWVGIIESPLGSSKVYNVKDCPRCGGVGVVERTCPKCGGAGAFHFTCYYCGGRGYIIRFPK